jgi:hypothetical protein
MKFDLMTLSQMMHNQKDLEFVETNIYFFLLAKYP